MKTRLPHLLFRLTCQTRKHYAQAVCNQWMNTMATGSAPLLSKRKKNSEQRSSSFMRRTLTRSRQTFACGCLISALGFGHWIAFITISTVWQYWRLGYLLQRTFSEPPLNTISNPLFPPALLTNPPQKSPSSPSIPVPPTAGFSSWIYRVYGIEFITIKTGTTSLIGQFSKVVTSFYFRPMFTKYAW